MNLSISRDSLRGRLGLGLTAALLVGLAVAVLLANRGNVAAQEHAISLPADFEQTVYASGLQRPSTVAFAPDGRLFAAERYGPADRIVLEDDRRLATLRVIKDGELLDTPFLSVPVVSLAEGGLIGVAVDPDFENNGYVYVYYTKGGGEGQGYSRISRFTASSDNPDVADPDSELVLLDDIPMADMHVGGALQFGLDGKLYFAVGDTLNRQAAQSIENLSGTIGRIDPHNYPDIIPADNPFVNTPGARPEVWAWGLRNPYTIAVDPATGKVYVNVVGEEAWEWIVELEEGANYGWPHCEGPVALGDHDPTTGPCPAEFTQPVFWYTHMANPLAESSSLRGCALIGGAFYRGGQFPAEYDGSYFFTDYCGQWIARMTPDGEVEPFATGTAEWATTLSAGPDGALYYIGFISGEVYRIEYTGDLPPAAPAPAIEPTPVPEATPTVAPADTPVAPTPTPLVEPTPTPAPQTPVGGGGCTPGSASAGGDAGWLLVALVLPALATVRGHRRRP